MHVTKGEVYRFESGHPLWAGYKGIATNYHRRRIKYREALKHLAKLLEGYPETVRCCLLWGARMDRLEHLGHNLDRPDFPPFIDTPYRSMRVWRGPDGCHVEFEIAERLWAKLS